MRYSLKFKLFTALCSMIVFFVIMSWLLNNIFLEKYYYHNKEVMLMENLKEVVDLYKSDPDNFTLGLEKLESLKVVHILIMDKNLKTLYESRQRNIDMRFRGPNPDERINIERIPKDKLDKILKGKPFVEKSLDKRLNSYFITLYAMMNDEFVISINTPVAAIEDSAEIANKFFVIIGLLTLVIGGIIIFFIASKFTKPILQLSQIAQRISVMDFSLRYPVKTRDEIGHLGSSINSLSEQLQESISELKEANEKLKADIEKERRIDEMRKEFITNVSHELKTPVALIQGYAEGLKININDDEENKNYYCEVIIDEALKMNKLVRNLLELSQIESGKISLDISDLDISELLGQVLKKNSIIFKNKGITVTVEKERDFVVSADCEMIEQVLVNYLNNAINHVDETGHIKINIVEVNKKVRVSVFNSGQHIPESNMELLWTSFYKIDKARTRSYGGTGLGLSIVKAIQEAHKNGFGLNNIEGGVEFWFEVDIA